MAVKTVDTDVLVVGAGPVGLALAGDLGWRGKRCVVLERGDGSIDQPRMDLVGVRTMEFCRRWGIVDWVEASPYNRDYPQDNIYLTGLNGFELGREPMACMSRMPPDKDSPQHRERCPQNMFDPILKRFALAQPGVDIRYGCEFLRYEQGEHGVVVEARCADGAPIRLSARYLVGCDGGRSAVREQMGVGMTGRGLLTYTTNAVFRCADLNELHDKRPGYRYMFVGPNGVWATLVAINGRDEWRMSIVGNNSDRHEYSAEEVKAVAYQLMGRPFEMEILSLLPWARRELVADSYQDGRVFIAGDACHLTSPTGGLGMNTGIGDAVDLSWKLAARLEGWGGEGLTDAYTVERRPVAVRITRFSTGNLQIMQGARSDERVFADDAEGAAIRDRVATALSTGLKREWHSANMHLGYRYAASPICVFNEPEDPADIERDFEEPVDYQPGTRPGARAPHAWLADGRSTLDWFGRGFVLVCLGGDSSDASPLQETAKAMDVPLALEANEEPHVVALYQTRYVLVRPDGHVAWRGNAIPVDCKALLSQVSGRKEK